MKIPVLHLTPAATAELRRVAQQNRNDLAMRRRHREQEDRVAELNRDIRQANLMRDENPLFGADFGDN